jgi:hypothetical protein
MARQQPAGAEPTHLAVIHQPAHGVHARDAELNAD